MNLKELIKENYLINSIEYKLIISDLGIQNCTL